MKKHFFLLVLFVAVILSGQALSQSLLSETLTNIESTLGRSLTPGERGRYIYAAKDAERRFNGIRRAYVFTAAESVGVSDGDIGHMVTKEIGVFRPIDDEALTKKVTEIKGRPLSADERAAFVSVDQVRKENAENVRIGLIVELSKITGLDTKVVAKMLPQVR